MVVNGLAARGATIEDDLAARDLTINAMALDESGVQVDPFGGRTDLEARILRHVPGFANDSIRILRTARFTAGLDSFNITPVTLALMTELTAAGASLASADADGSHFPCGGRCPAEPRRAMPPESALRRWKTTEGRLR